MSDDQVPVEDHTEEKSVKHYRKRTTDLHPLFGGAKTEEYNAAKRWRADIPRAGADDGGV